SHAARRAIHGESLSHADSGGRPLPTRSAPASGSRPRNAPHKGQNDRDYQAALALVINARNFSGSLRPGTDSTPLATSTAQGYTARTAAATFSGMRPPAKIRRRKH